MGDKETIEIHERVTRVETNVETIMSNHLPHIQAKVDKVDKRLWWVLSSVILGFLISITLLLIR
jgi:hypothetical protein